jgi:glucokinase
VRQRRPIAAHKIETTKPLNGFCSFSLFASVKLLASLLLCAFALIPMRAPKTYIGLDVGGTNIKCVAFSPKGKILAEETEPTSDDGTKSWLNRARDVARKIFTQFPANTRIGVAAPGLPARDGYSIATMPARLHGLENLNWQKWLGLKPPIPVFNDGQAALLAETWLGAAKGSINVLLLTLGTGVGGAAIVDGCLLHGHIGRAGHVGHFCLNPDGPLDIVGTPGSLEDAIGEHTVHARTNGRFGSTRDLVAAYESGSAEAAQVWLRSVKALGAALASLINIFDSEIVVIGGGIADANDSLFVPLRATLDKFEWRPHGQAVKLVKASLGHIAGAAGAAYGALLQTQNKTAISSSK